MRACVKYPVPKRATRTHAWPCENPRAHANYAGHRFSAPLRGMPPRTIDLPQCAALCCRVLPCAAVCCRHYGDIKSDDETWAVRVFLLLNVLGNYLANACKEGALTACLLLDGAGTPCCGDTPRARVCCLASFGFLIVCVFDGTHG